jgi:predicted metal-dependent hydrolase
MTLLELPSRRSVTLGGEARDYELRRSERRTLGITVEPTGELVVTAPRELVIERIETALQRRREWIRRRSREAELLPPLPLPREWVSGETHRYLGRQYRLRVRRGGEREVKLSGPFFVVSIRDPSDTAQVRRLMERWLREHARATFARRLGALVRSASRLRLAEPPPIVVRKLGTRWGSCTPQGRILVNLEAVRLPLPCIDYLLLHELCHLRVPHHGVRFWRLLDACMPDWERWRERLARAEL